MVPTKFTRRHEQELAEIKELTRALDRQVREAIEQTRRIREGYVFEDAYSSLGDGAAGGSPESEPQSLREAIDALAARHGLGDEAARRLENLVWLVDWGRANFVPAAASSESQPDPRGVRSASRRMAVSTVAEALSGLELEAVRGARRIGDIGSGAGFPGLVIAIALPEARVTLIEKVPERCAFLRRAGEKLGLENVEVVEGTSQEWSEGVGTCDLVTSRKVGRIATMVSWSAPLLAPEGTVVLWPGTTDFAAEEPAEAVDAARAAGLRPAGVHRVATFKRNGQPVVKHLHIYERI